MSLNVTAQRPRGEFATHPRPTSGGDSAPRRRVERGCGMLTPARDFSWRGERYVARRTRVHPVHPVCASERAVDLVPAWSGETDEAVLEVLWRTGRTWEPVEQTRTEPPPAGTPTRRPLFGLDYTAPETSSPGPRNDDVSLAPLVAPKSFYIASAELERQIRESNAERHRRIAEQDKQR